MKRFRNPKLLFGTRCHLCPLAVAGNPVAPVLADGPAQALGALVGEGPGREEAERGRPFVGATGEELDNSILAAGLQRARLLILNATCCRPPMNKTEGMMKKAVDACRPALVQQLQAAKVQHVFAMGAWAAYALTGTKKGMKKRRGFVRQWVIEVVAKLEEVEALKQKRVAERAAKKKVRGKS